MNNNKLEFFFSAKYIKFVISEEYLSINQIHLKSRRICEI